MDNIYKVITSHNPETEIVEFERWEIDGKLHRVGGPALIHRDPEIGVAFAEEWFRSNLPHRFDGAAVIYRDRKSGATLREEFHVYGKKVEPSMQTAAPSLEDGPAL